MSFWDHIKPSKPEPAVVELTVSQKGRTLQLRWDDGSTSELSARLLRQRCPCASCVDEWTSQRTLEPAQVKPDLILMAAVPVGNYAVRLTFADRHQTGIFPWPLLRELSAATPD